ncbi:MAG: GIY-YIG nuclease family protein [Alphaproteobacteria bacterium]
MTAWLYILATKKNGPLYVGVTTNLAQRLQQHRAKAMPSFTARYNIGKLVYVEEFSDLKDAQENENRFKRWRRDWKVSLIENFNPDWRDLSGSYL